MIVKRSAWLLAALTLAACSQEPATETPVPIGAAVAVAGGTVQGIVGEDGLKQYHGIPYAAPPLGELRWKPPVPVVAWEGARDATTPGPACMQPQDYGTSFYGQSGFAMDEDCLTLNVWTRAAHAGDALPVMVWIHGGALVTGQGAMYPGELLTSKGVVLVTVNYRLGRFGFLAHPGLTAESAVGASGNQGLRDQIVALEWVRDNVAAFGGDPGNVTIFGESAGALSVSLLQASPKAAGLFHRVIGQSGGAFSPMQHRAAAIAYAGTAEELGERFGAALAGDDGDSSLSALRMLPAAQVLEVTSANPEFTNYDTLAVVDGDVIPDEVATIFVEGRQADVPVLIGSNSDEATAFMEYFEPLFGEGKAGLAAYVAATLPEVADELPAFYPADSDEQASTSFMDLFADVAFTYPMRAWARDMEPMQGDAYLYWFTWAPPIEQQAEYGAFHAAELGYIFGNLDLFGAVPTDADREFSDLMASIWTQFAKAGDPNGEGLPAWPAYARANEAYMELGVDTGAKSGLRLEQLALIERAWAERRAAE